jgi:hypothetical protein
VCLRSMLFTAWAMGTTLSDLVPHIVRVRTKEQMVGIHTWRVVAHVTHAQVRRNRLVCKLPCPMGGRSCCAIEHDTSVATTIPRIAAPQPTWSKVWEQLGQRPVFVDLFPKARNCLLSVVRAFSARHMSVATNITYGRIPNQSSNSVCVPRKRRVHAATTVAQTVGDGATGIMAHVGVSFQTLATPPECSTTRGGTSIVPRMKGVDVHGNYLVRR